MIVRLCELVSLCVCVVAVVVVVVASWSKQCILEAQRALEQEFGAAIHRGDPRQVHAGLIQALTQASGDPDDVLHEWVAGAKPLGIENEIQSRGIFPKLQQGEDQAATPGGRSSIVMLGGEDGQLCIRR